jgi:hypothetical protein
LDDCGGFVSAGVWSGVYIAVGDYKLPGDEEMADNMRITIMTEAEAWDRYNQWMASDKGREMFYLPTFSGWLQHKGIKINDAGLGINHANVD